MTTTQDSDQIPRDGIFAPEAPACRVWWDQRNAVARNTWSQGAVCRLTDAQAISQTITELGYGAVPVLVDMREVSGIERPARRHLADTASNALAIALLVGSPVSRLIGHVMAGSITGVPCQIFTDEPTALAWLGTNRRLGPASIATA